MRCGSGIADNRTGPAVAIVCRHGLNTYPHLAQRINDPARIATACESYEDNLAAELPKHTGNVAPLPARLNHDCTATLNLACLKAVNLQDSIYRKIRTNNKKHPI
jgi:hypothetical protein